MLDRKLKYLPMIGKKFNSLTVLDAYPDPKEQIYRLKCICDCGNETHPRAGLFLRGAHKSCGKCYIKKYKDMIGNKFDRLTIVDFIDKGKLFSCLCSCGNTKNISVASILSGNTRSCGCLKKEKFTNKTHGCSYGDTFMPEYKVWTGIKMRCQNPKAQGYKYWGGRGIKLCDRWQLFENFIADMGPRPTNKHSIDRINNNGNYEPGNCHWVTRDIQRKNQRWWGTCKLE